MHDAYTAILPLSDSRELENLNKAHWDFDMHPNE